MSDTSGPEWSAPFAFYDPETSCWRTSQATFLSDSDRYSETWPRSGMTRAGCAYELPMPALPTVEPASLSLRLLPTPVADHSRGLPQPGTDYASLPNAVLSLLPTPRATDGTKGGPNQRGSKGDLMLPSAVCQLGDARQETPTHQDGLWDT